MEERHIPEELFERFFRVEASKEEMLRIARHLLAGCARCSETALRLATESDLFGRTPGGKSGWELAYDEVLDRALAFADEEERRLTLERLRGWGQWAELAPMNPELRFAVVESDPRFHTFGFYERLLAVARWVGRSEPAEAVDIVRLAILVAARIDHDEEPWDDLTRLPLQWVEGKIASRMRQYAEAENLFAELWTEFRARGLHQEVALVTIDLAESLARKGEPARAAELAAECYAIMEGRGLHQDALAAWLVFHDALANMLRGGDLFDRIADYYRRHWFAPAAFDPNRS